ncbi:MAG: tetratricopeptide repeat protein [Kofleriaceae bacterium]
MRSGALAVLFAVACGGPQIKEPASTDLSKATPATLEAERPREGDPHTVQLRVYADPGVRALPRWKEEITEQIDYASQLLRPLLGAELSVVEIKDWSRAGDPAEASKQLAALDKGDGVTWVVGYVTASDKASTVLDELGDAEVLGKHVIVRGWADRAESDALAKTLPDLKETERTEVLGAHRRHKQTVVLLHQLALSLGALAEADPTWIAHPTYSPKQSSFADRTRELMTLALDARVAGDKDQDIAKKLLEVIDRTEWGGWIPTHKEQTVSLLRAIVDVNKAGKIASDIPPAALDQVGRIRQLARQGDMANALAELDNILAAYPGTASLHQLKCDFLLAPGKQKDQNALRAERLRRAKDPKTIVACKRVIDLAPGDPGPHFAFAETFKDAGDIASARAELLLAEPKIANLPDLLNAEAAWRRLIGIYQQLGSLTWTEDAIIKAKLDKDPIASTIVQTRVRYGVPRGAKFVKPEDEAALVATVRASLELVYASKYGDAEKTLAAAEKKWAGAPGLAATRCDLALRMGSIEAARAACNKALEAQPDESWALYLSGVIALKEASGTKAGIDFLKRAIVVDAELGQAWRTLAKAYTRAKDRAAYEALAKEYQAKFNQALPP